MEHDDDKRDDQERHPGDKAPPEDEEKRMREAFERLMGNSSFGDDTPASALPPPPEENLRFPDEGFPEAPDSSEETPETEGESESFDFESIGGPLPTRPWALVTEGTVEEGDLVLHRDYEAERSHVMLFETLDDAYALAAQFREATGQDATPKPCDPRVLEERFYIRLFRPGGLVIDISRDAYLELTDMN